MSYVITTNNLTKRYDEQLCVKNLNIHIQKGTIYGLLGRNGAGKTTTMKMLLNLTRPTYGEINIYGLDLHKHIAEILPKMGSAIETPGFYPNLTGSENLKIFSVLRGIRRPDNIKKALDIVGLPYNDKKLFSQYSLGMKQRLAMANAVLHDPEILILDEPTNGLDPIGISELRKFILSLSKDYGKTILLSSHILAEIELLADDIGIIHEGNILEEGHIESLKSKNSQYYHFAVSDSERAIKIIQCRYPMGHSKKESENCFLVYDQEIQVNEIIKTFVENGLDVYDVHLNENSLEDYFKKITGGVGIA